MDYVENFNLTPRNFASFVSDPRPVDFGFFLVDPVDTCNVNCVYCKSLRSRERIDIAAFRRALQEKVRSIHRLQFGCTQECTLHFGLAEFFEAAAAMSSPPKVIQMITNGMLLHRHEVERFQKAGLSLLLVSIDSHDQGVTDRLRPGIDLDTLVRNIRQFRERCPGVELMCSTVISRYNLTEMDRLLEFTQELGFGEHSFREVCGYTPEERVGGGAKAATDETFSEICLMPGEFAAFETAMRQRYPGLRCTFVAAEAVHDPRTSHLHKSVTQLSP